MLTWLAGLPTVDKTRVAIGGASAGGGLATACALLARDRGELAPAHQLLIYPMLDDRSSRGPTNRPYRMWSPKINRFAWAAYLAPPTRESQFRRDAKTSPDCRRLGSVSEPTISFITRRSGMRND